MSRDDSLQQEISTFRNEMKSFCGRLREELNCLTSNLRAPENLASTPDVEATNASPAREADVEATSVSLPAEDNVKHPEDNFDGVNESVGRLKNLRKRLSQMVANEQQLEPDPSTVNPN